MKLLPPMDRLLLTSCRPGEQHISRDYNKLWRRKCCPIRSVDENHDEYYELVSSGTPPTPKPDIMYGYNDSAFGIQTRHLRRWNSLLVTNKAPWFPYWVIQWKTSINAGVQQAAIQARRDGSAATAAL